MNHALRALGGLLLVLVLLAGPASAAHILLVVGNTTLTAGDARIKTLLESKGHVLTLKSSSAAVSGDATGKALVIITASVWSSDVNTKFRTVAVPVMNWEQNIMDDMGLANGTSGEFGTLSSMTQVQINVASHQMAAGFNGGVAVYNGSGSKGTYAKPNANAVKVATVVGDATRATIFGYEAGAAMFGLNAPARRVGFFLDDLTPADMNDNGVKLFHAACNWAMNVTQPAIAANQHPVSTAVNVGQTASFSVTATGGALSYQWRKNGATIPGATNSSYTTPPTVAGDNGALFSVVVTNSAGSVTSQNAVLTVGNPSPVIATHPRDRAIEEGQVTTFSVEAAGTGLTYQWKKNGSNVGTNSPNYTIPPSTLDDHNASFTCVVTNGSGSATSNAAKLLIVKTPFIAETQYYEEMSSPVPSFRLGWHKDNQYAFFEQGGVERLRLKDDIVNVPAQLGFGVSGRMGFHWVQGSNNVDTLSLVSGMEGSNQVEVLQVRHHLNGLEGLYFPAGLRFPFRGVPDVLDPNLTWNALGDADAEGLRYFRAAEGLDNNTEEYGSLNANRVELRQAFESTEIDHEFTDTLIAYMDAGQLKLTRHFASPTANSQADTTVVEAGRIETGTLVAKDVVMTPKWRVASSLPDFVFQQGYPLPSLEEVEAFARKNRHLPHFPSAERMAEEGVSLTEMNVQLLRTVEELTLHLVALQKEVKGQKRALKSQKKEMQRLKGRLERMSEGKAVAQ